MAILKILSILVLIAIALPIAISFVMLIITFIKNARDE